MKVFFTDKNKKGFTIVELVIVIAVIAILAAVLIPTFSSIIKKAQLSKDCEVVGDVNKILIAEYYGKNESIDLEQAKKTITDGGFNFPLPIRTDDCAVFWIPGENMAVLFDFSKGEVVYPDNYSDIERTTSWINLSYPVTPDVSEEVPETGNPSEESHNTPEQTQEQSSEPQQPIEEKVYVMLSGTDVNKKIKNLNKSAEKIVFGKISEYTDKTNGSSENLSSDGKIVAYLDGNDIYVLSDGVIQTRSDASQMFSGLDKLKSISFENFNTESTTDMREMFNSCSALTQLDLSSFNTSRVKYTDKMFYNCSSLEKISVKKGTDWEKASKIRSSLSMFLYCEKLSNYSVTLIGAIFGKPNIGFAHTGEGGFFTAK